MQIEAKDIRPGDILIFKRDPRDKVAGFLSMILKLFYPRWKRCFMPRASFPHFDGSSLPLWIAS